MPPAGVSLPEALFGNQSEAPPLPEPFRKMTRVPECRTRERFSGCRASAPRVPELKPRPYPVDFPTTLRVPSERDTCPRVPPADTTLRKPPELATLRVATCPKPTDHPDAARQPAHHPGRLSRTLGECAACRFSRERTFCLP